METSPLKILIICGEPSGDLHAGALSRQLQLLRPDIVVEGVGGEHLEASGARILHHIKDLSVLGFFSVLRKLPAFIALKRSLIAHLENSPPQAVVLIDFSGFNLRLLPAIPPGIPVFYYIAPQLWASREGRVRRLKQRITRMLVIFPFEEAFYRTHGIEAEWVGHPLLDMVRPSVESRSFLEGYGLKEDRPTLCLLPGSRLQEIAYILPVMAEAAELIARRLEGLQCMIAQAPGVEERVYEAVLRKRKIRPLIVKGRTYDCIASSDLCLVASGTATLETALLEKPHLIIYRMSLLNYLLYKPQVKLSSIGLTNIIAGKKIVPEFIQFEARPRAIAKTALALLGDTRSCERIKKDLAGVRSSLGEPGAARRAAQALLRALG